MCSVWSDTRCNPEGTQDNENNTNGDAEVSQCDHEIPQTYASRPRRGVGGVIGASVGSWLPLTGELEVRCLGHTSSCRKPYDR